MRESVLRQNEQSHCCYKANKFFNTRVPGPGDVAVLANGEGCWTVRLGV